LDHETKPHRNLGTYFSDAKDLDETAIGSPPIGGVG